jgi:LssY C-terminus
MAETSVDKTSAIPRPRSVNVLIDNMFFLFGGAAAVWLAYIALTESFSWGWYLIAFFVFFWAMMAYLVLPRLHRILTSIYVPNYFIGRARTSDGLLGDPINLALLGSESQLHVALKEAGWTRADDVTLRSGLRIVRSTILRQSYDEAPVSPLFLFGHQQDAAYQQEVHGNPAKRHHVRFWRCPDDWKLPGGVRVDWLAAGTFDRSVGFSLFTLQVTHKIDANTDIERDHIVRTLTAADSNIAVNVIPDFSAGYHSRNGGGDTIETDGDLPVVDVSRVVVEGNLDDDDVTALEMRAIRAARRPSPTTLGVVLMSLRIVVGISTIGAAAFGWRQFIADGQQLSADEFAIASIFGGVVLGVLGIALAFYLVLTVLIAVGSNWARIAAMALSSVIIVGTAVSYVRGEAVPGLFTSVTNLLGVPLDILVVISLSSQRSRIWARRTRPSRRARRAAAAEAAAHPDEMIDESERIAIAASSDR